jgi:hypothetical protein
MGPASALQLTLERQDGGQLRLQAAGLTSTNVNLETSFDLTEWFFVQAAGVTNGRAGFIVNRDEPLSAQFFRAVETPPPFTGRVGPQPDLSRSVAALLTPEAGGVLSLAGPGGVVYELTVGPQQVWEPVVITLTAITNFTDLPLTNSFRAAVQLEPEGLEFRSEAQLRIRFPQVVPQLEMVGYGFAADGGGFHLQPWEVRSNEVVLLVRHFSGVGVAAEPFPPSGNFAQRFDRAWSSTRDARDVADQWVGEAHRDASRKLQEGRMTLEEFRNWLDVLYETRDRMEYRLGVQPLLDTAMRDCAVGQVVLRRLDQLLSRREYRTGGPYLSGPLAVDLVRLYSPLRCNCAHYYLELCERDPNASGVQITRELTGLLQDMEIIYGLTGDPTCDLGDNAAILERLRQGPCHKTWEGNVVYTRTETERWTIGSGGPFETRKNRQQSYTFRGRVTEVLEHDGDSDPEIPEFNWESWRLRLLGQMTASLDDDAVEIYTDQDWRTTSIDERQGRFNQEVKGDLVIRFEQGQPETVVASVGLEDVRYSMQRVRTTEKMVECWGSPPPCCPCPVPEPRTSQQDGTDQLYFSFGSIPRDVKEMSWQNGELKIVFERVEQVGPPPPGFENWLNERVERMTVSLVRGRGR